MRVTGDGHVPSPWSLLRLQAAADDSLAVADRHVNPRLRIAAELRRPAARVVAGRRAVVLAGFGDAVALLGLEPRRWHDGLLCGQNGRGGDGGREHGRNENTGIHANPPLEGLASGAPTWRPSRLPDSPA